MRAVLIASLLVGLAGCAHQKPLVYPNTTARAAGPQGIEQATEECMAQAEAHGLDYDRGGELAKRTARGGAVGAAGGAAAGAVFGNAGRGAASGAAAGATHGLLHGLFAADGPHPVYRRFVETCLRDKGYRPIGWE